MLKQKTYKVYNRETRQVLDAITRLRVMKNQDGTYTMQYCYSVPRGEDPQEIWVDIPVVDHDGDLISYTLPVEDVK